MTYQADDFDRPAGPLGVAPTGAAWQLRPTGPYDDAGATIAQETSIITLDGAGQAVPDVAQAVDHLQFATLDFGTGDIDNDIEFLGNPTIFTGLGMVFRWTSPTQYWNTFYYNAGGTGPQIFLECQDGPTFADASPRINVASAPGAIPNILRVVAQGDDIEVYFNGVLAISLTDSTFATSTHHGISWFHSGNGITRFNTYVPEPSGLTVGPLHMRAA